MLLVTEFTVESRDLFVCTALHHVPKLVTPLASNVLNSV